MTRLRRLVEPAVWSEAWAAGRRLSLDELVSAAGQKGE